MRKTNHPDLFLSGPIFPKTIFTFQSAADMWTDLAGAIVVVTGGGSGTGRAICQELANSDIKVIIADINIETANETRNLLKNPNHHAPVQVDISSSDSVNQLAAYIEGHFGECPKGIVNCAGVNTEDVGRTSCLDCTEKSWNRVIDINLKGTFLINTVFARWMKKDKISGSIVNIASVARNGLAPFLEYSSSKAGVIGLTKSLAQELGSLNIRVNAICPGMIEAPMIKWVPSQISNGIASINPMRRIGQPEEVASVCGFLLSKASGYVTGQAINVSGGVSVQDIFPYSNVSE